MGRLAHGGRWSADLAIRPDSNPCHMLGGPIWLLRFAPAISLFTDPSIHTELAGAYPGVREKYPGVRQKMVRLLQCRLVLADNFVNRSYQLMYRQSSPEQSGDIVGHVN